MKNKSISFLFTLSLISSVAFGQEEMFRILVSKGDNKMVSNSSKEQKRVLIGEKLYQNDKIILSENSYLGLAHKSGKTIELKKSGTYEVSKLLSEVTAQNSSVAKKYIDFIIDEMTSMDEDMVKNKYKYMEVLGSVERATITGSAIHVLAPKETYSLPALITLKWIPADPDTVYVVTLTDLSYEPVYSVETNDNQVKIDLDKLNFKNGKNFLWKVSVKGNKMTESEPCILKCVDEEKMPELEKQIAEMKVELFEETAISKLILASFYEENGLILDALINYEAALKIEPQVEAYKIAYGKFLKRNKLA